MGKWSPEQRTFASVFVGEAGDTEGFLIGTTVDSNQRKAFDLALDRQLDRGFEVDYQDAYARALRTAEQLPTARTAAKAIAAMRVGDSYCYLAFYGTGGAAQYLKVGVSRHPEQRLYGMATGNPLDCVWAFVCKIGDAKEAYGVEQGLHRHLAAHKRRGEWFEVGDTDWPSADAFARQLSAVAKGLNPRAGDFEPLEYRDGR